MQRTQLAALLSFSLFLFGCEGHTAVTKTVHNNTSHALNLTLDLDLSGFLPDSVNFSLAPGETRDVAWYEHRGKCQDCTAFENGALHVDSLILHNLDISWSDAFLSAGDERWSSSNDEGMSWILFRHTIELRDSDID
jgi:hypothetical protein|tara:strand:+ start:447 stop:857 length:411 start_codon:yes stop_codon:yes gene_type:complete